MVAEWNDRKKAFNSPIMMKIYLLTPLRKKKPKGNLKTRIANKLGIDLLNKPWTNTFQDNSCWNLRSGSCAIKNNCHYFTDVQRHHCYLASVFVWKGWSSRRPAASHWLVGTSHSVLSFTNSCPSSTCGETGTVRAALSSAWRAEGSE